MSDETKDPMREALEALADEMDEYSESSLDLTTEEWADRLRALLASLPEATPDEVARLREQKDGAYRERDQVVALAARMALALGWRAGLRRHEPNPDPAWDEDWKNVVAIDLPIGPTETQVTWHFHDSERPLFHSLPPYPAPWDGHDTAEKYRRCDAPWIDVSPPKHRVPDMRACAQCGDLACFHDRDGCHANDSAAGCLKKCRAFIPPPSSAPAPSTAPTAEPLRVYLVRCDVTQIDGRKTWFIERCVTDSADRALAMVEGYRSRAPAPLTFSASVIGTEPYSACAHLFRHSDRCVLCDWSRSTAPTAESAPLDFGAPVPPDAEPPRESFHGAPAAPEVVDSTSPGGEGDGGASARPTSNGDAPLAAPSMTRPRTPGTPTAGGSPQHAAVPEVDPAHGPMTWGLSTDEESFHGHYASKEEALANVAAELAPLEPGQRFWVGGGRLWRPSLPGVSADLLFDNLQDHAGDECGEIAEHWLSAVSREDSDALEEEILATVLRWLERTGLMPKFYCCEVTEEHRAPHALTPSVPGAAPTNEATKEE